MSEERDERPMSRRSMLRGAVGAAAAIGAAGALTGGLAGTAQAGTAAANGWSRGRRVPEERIGIQLYTLRNDLQADLEGTLEALADIGYRNVELAGTYGRSVREFRGLLDRYGLRAVSAHVGFDGADVDALIADAKVLGYHYADCAWANYDSIGEWRDFADRLDKAGKAFRKAGIKYGYHNHAHEFRKIDGVRPFDVISQVTSRHNVHFEYDLYWLVDGGIDPVEQYYREFGRVRQFHVKDRKPEGGFADLGTGTIDFGRIFRDTRRGHVSHFIVEHDQPTNALRTAEVGYDYLTDLRF
ncbi:Sugar phosphate isomerase/epimerase [Amycolatopsis marina]|uniref:Sugar phosphate isomerase/epimerase n=1 Tax=Amycolatopsis marina TaxID=490629 RepID=A0A1I1C8K9_9PSEU|nr:sugar phosphate isomerase/epimerase [Amycolatopsis marina]SFB58727.1 Sugar phosphate isomerase/epimerase [Amycolatopsis marina]